MELDLTNIGTYFKDLASTGLLVVFLMKTLTENLEFVRKLHRFLKLALVFVLGVGVSFLGNFLGYLSGDIKSLFLYGLLSGAVAAGMYDTALKPFMDILVKIAQQLAQQFMKPKS